jgi:predicted deacylase
MARAFGAPVLLNSSLRPGSLRAAAHDAGVPVIVYEAGEALRFDELSIRAGVRGIVNVMRHLEMLPPRKREHPTPAAFVAHKSVWVRASETGMLVTRIRLGAEIEKGMELGRIHDPLGEGQRAVRSPVHGILIGRTNLPLANEGDALFHIATFDELEHVIEELEAFREDPELDPLEDEEPPI